MKKILLIAVALMAMVIGANGEDLEYFRAANGKYEYKNASGAVVIEPKFDYISDFCEDLASVSVGDMVGRINKKRVRVDTPEEIAANKKTLAKKAQEAREAKERAIREAKEAKERVIREAREAREQANRAKYSNSHSSSSSKKYITNAYDVDGIGSNLVNKNIKYSDGSNGGFFVKRSNLNGCIDLVVLDLGSGIRGSGSSCDNDHNYWSYYSCGIGQKSASVSYGDIVERMAI